MSKKTIKLISAIVTVLMVISLTSSVFALKPTDLKANTSATGTTEVKELGNNLMGVLQTAGVVVAVVILIVLGIKYMMGSASEKAEYKKTMIPYVIGAILIFGATTVANIVYQFADSL